MSFSGHFVSVVRALCFVFLLFLCCLSTAEQSVFLMQVKSVFELCYPILSVQSMGVCARAGADECYYSDKLL